MAIDTRDRRASAMACGLLFFLQPVLADGSVAIAADRQHLIGHYRGISVAVSVPGLPGLEYVPGVCRLHYTTSGDPLHYKLPDGRIHYGMPRED